VTTPRKPGRPTNASRGLESFVPLPTVKIPPSDLGRLRAVQRASGLTWGAWVRRALLAAVVGASGCAAEVEGSDRFEARPYSPPASGSAFRSTAADPVDAAAEELSACTGRALPDWLIVHEAASWPADGKPCPLSECATAGGSTIVEARRLGLTCLCDGETTTPGAGVTGVVVRDLADRANVKHWILHAVFGDEFHGMDDLWTCDGIRDGRPPELGNYQGIGEWEE
jgi:hypothetical protein